MNLTLLRFPAAALLAASACFASYDPKDMDLSVSPKVDFYQYAEGGWMKANPIPADRSEWGSFDELQEHNERILKGVLDRALKAKEPGFVEKLVGDFYYSGMDEAAVEAAGASPLRPLLDRVDAVASTAEFGKLAAGLQMDGLGVFFAFGSEQDPRDSQNVIAGQGQGGLGLPDRDYYFRDDDASKKLREKYVAHVAKMLSLIRVTRMRLPRRSRRRSCESRPRSRRGRRRPRTSGIPSRTTTSLRWPRSRSCHPTSTGARTWMAWGSIPSSRRRREPNRIRAGPRQGDSVGASCRTGRPTCAGMWSTTTRRS